MDVREKQSSEKRLIDREALLSFEKMDAELCASCGEHHTAEDVIMMIKTAPTVDAVEVVRCRDCKYHEDNPVIGFEHCCLHDLTMRHNDFCSYGKREGGTD